MALILMKQIIVLFLMMGCGLAVVKLGMLKVEDSKALSAVSLYLLLPSVVIHSFDIEYTPEVMSGFLLALAAALAFHGILFVICTVLSSIFHLGAVEKCSLIYTNAGNIIMPLVAALLGEEWQIYATAFLAVQMTILFSHGQSVMEGKPGINWKKIVTNPNMIAVVAGLVLFLTPLQLPDVLADTMTSMARAVGPVSMIMLGMALADIEWKKLFTGKRVYGMVLARMVLLPLVAVFFLRTWGMMSSVPDSRSILLVTLLAAITPTASTIPQMAQLYDQDAAYASAINVMTTVVCVVTMPWLKLRSALTTISVPQLMTSNPQPKPYRIFSAIHFFSGQTKKQICFPTRKPSFPQDFSDNTSLAKNPEIRHFSALIYLFLTASTPSRREYQIKTYPHKITEI